MAIPGQRASRGDRARLLQAISLEPHPRGTHRSRAPNPGIQATKKDGRYRRPLIPALRLIVPPSPWVSSFWLARVNVGYCRFDGLKVPSVPREALDLSGRSEGVGPASLSASPWRAELDVGCFRLSACLLS